MSSRNYSEIRISFRDSGRINNNIHMLTDHMNNNSIGYNIFSSGGRWNGFSSCFIQLTDEITGNFIDWLQGRNWIKSVKVKDITIETTSFNLKMES